MLQPTICNSFFSISFKDQLFQKTLRDVIYFHKSLLKYTCALYAQNVHWSNKTLKLEYFNKCGFSYNNRWQIHFTNSPQQLYYLFLPTLSFLLVQVTLTHKCYQDANLTQTQLKLTKTHQRLSTNTPHLVIAQSP